MDWSKIGSLVGSAAPVLGGLLGGPAGAVVGGLIAGALGVDNTPEAVDSALKLDPAATVKLQELQLNAQVQLQQLAVTAEMNRLQAENETFNAEVEDRKSARSFAASQVGKDWIRPSITIAIIMCAFVIVYSVFFGKSIDTITDPTASLTVGLLIGYVFNELKSVLAFWFGTTKDSTIKTNAMSQMLNKKEDK